MTRIGSVAALVLSLIALPLFAERARFANSVKYKDSSTATTRGRSGSATIEARALIGKDGATLLEVATESLDTAGAGTIERLQVRIPTTGDELTLQYTPRSNRFVQSLPDLLPGAALSIQALVTGVDGTRTDVVSAGLTVKLRPDLETSMLIAPPHGVVNRPLRITALVSEKNGDTGARADCVLRSGETELRRISGLWVDAGGSVTCEFGWPFDSTGVKPLRVEAETTSPAEYDPANNGTDGQTQVYDDAQQFATWLATATEFANESWRRTTSALYSRYREETSTRQGAYFSATVPRTLDLRNVQASALVLTDGNLLYDGTNLTTEFRPLPEWLFGVPGYVRISGHGFDGMIMAENFDLRRVGGDVIYHDEGFEYSWRGYYSWNDSGSYSHGPVARPFGSTVSFNVSISDGTQMWAVDTLMPMAPFSSVGTHGPICYDHWGYGYTCEEWSDNLYGVHGYDEP
ncbi:MAG TPA: hypothetical protein VGF48_25835 [Thermoanaerobaculia bacterium]|jgi:hypothetical protein